ncbi:MAG: hypothetical protein GWN18_11715, partial [Thermoplasmata archaeon]|nr:hypothetical protein [Thermoplasmata archaeon]NIS12716.1 hypothetical protein [Thermoplasmata archaeon]NIS20633.1 hypothetical protein [Thermoplasmata archaeon]NIT78018.1 hypothetical protein [Thermoplasmata archaeon]NIU49706.1 hypothetical protein [Thermoplasmata archaeon]
MELLLADLTQLSQDIAGLNATNQAQLAAALSDMLDGLDGLDAHISARMDGLEGSIADNTTALLEYIDLQTEQVALLMEDLNASMAAQLAAINASLSEFRSEAGMGMAAIADYLMEMEANGSAHHGEVLDGLDETMALIEGLNETTLDELRTRLIALSEDLGALNDSEAARHQNTVDVMLMELDGLSTQVTDGFNATDSQLAALSKLDDILEQLNAISDDVADVKESAGGSTSTWIMLAILAFVIITIIMLFLLMGRIRDLSYSQPPPPREPEREPTVAPATKPAEAKEEAFELMLEEPEMYPETPGLTIITPPEPEPPAESPA